MNDLALRGRLPRSEETNADPAGNAADAATQQGSSPAPQAGGHGDARHGGTRGRRSARPGAGGGHGSRAESLRVPGGGGATGDRHDRAQAATRTRSARRRRRWLPRYTRPGCLQSGGAGGPRALAAHPRVGAEATTSAPVVGKRGPRLRGGSALVPLFPISTPVCPAPTQLLLRDGPGRPGGPRRVGRGPRVDSEGGRAEGGGARPPFLAP